MSIQRGKLVISPASGVAPPGEWLENNSIALQREILSTVGIDAYQYDNYATGRYEVGLNGKRAPGVSIQFLSLLTEQPAYVVFNAILDYERGSKKGKALPDGKFRVTKRYNFYKFWIRTGLAMPPRLGSVHDYMGNLGGILFSGTTISERLDCGSLSPLLVRSEWLKSKILPDNSRTAPVQLPYSNQTTSPYSDSATSHTQQGFQPDQSTGAINHGNKVVRDTEIRNTPADPREQSVEEWLEDYEGSPN